MRTITLNEAAQDLLSVMNKVNENHEPLMVTHKHHKSMVIMSMDDFNAWQDTAYFTCFSANAKEEIRTPTVWRKPSAKIAGKGQILGDIMTPVVATEDWSVLA